MNRYTATATRSGKWWVVQCDQHPGAISQVARLSQAADVHREAIAFVADVPEDEVEVEVRPVLPDDVEEHLTQAEQLRETAARANSGAAREVRTAARALRDAGLSVRDIGTVLGVSYQRAQQLATENTAAVPPTTRPEDEGTTTREHRPTSARRRRETLATR